MQHYTTEMAKKIVLGCVIPPLAVGASSRNLGLTFLANSLVCGREGPHFPFLLPLKLVPEIFLGQNILKKSSFHAID